MSVDVSLGAYVDMIERDYLRGDSYRAERPLLVVLFFRELAATLEARAALIEREWRDRNGGREPF